MLVWILFRWIISSNDFGNEIGNFVVCTSYSCLILSPWELNHCPITKIDQYENWWMFLLWRPVNRNRAPLNLWFYSIKFIPLVQWRNFVVPKNIITRDPVYSMNTTMNTTKMTHGFLWSKPRDSWFWTSSMNLTCKMAYIIRSISSFHYLFRDIITWNYGQRNK